jgi:hypothetical protein
VKRRGLGVAACLLAGLWCVAAHATDSSSGGLRGLQLVRSADTAGRGVVSVGLDLAGHALEDTAGSRHDFLVQELQLGLGLGRALELGATLPLRAWRATGVTATRIEPNSLLGWGDLVVAGKLRVPLPAAAVRLALLCEVSLPTGSALRGMSSGTTDEQLGGALTLDFGRMDRLPPARMHLNLTRRWNRNESDGFGLASLQQPAAGGFWPPAYPAVPAGEQAGYNDALRYLAGLEFVAARTSLFTEFGYEQFWHLSGVPWRSFPVWVTEGAQYALPHGFDLRGAVDVSLQRDDPPPTVPRLPEWRFHLGITWHRTLGLGDRDEDGIPDQHDLCPHQPEDVDGYQDADGCPDLDNDADGVPDRVDVAPNLPEDFDNFQDEDGRPDLDNDGDGIRDDQDGCPNEPEDYDGDRDTDGCPDLAPVPAAPSAGVPPASNAPLAQPPPAEPSPPAPAPPSTPRPHAG